MISNYWEEQKIDKAITEFHESQVKQMNLPEWIRNIKCPFCNKEMPLRSIRNISLCLNARNFGEIAIEVLCDECVKMDTIYFRTEIKTMPEFVSFLESDIIKSDVNSLLEEEMYKANYNNIIAKMIK